MYMLHMKKYFFSNSRWMSFAFREMSDMKNLGPFYSFFFFTATHTYVLYGIYSILYIYGNCTVIHYFGMGVKRSLWMSSWQWCLPPQLSDKITSPPNSIRSPLPPFRISIIITDGSLWDTHHLSPPRGPESRRAGALVMAQQKIMLSLFHCMSE